MKMRNFLVIICLIVFAVPTVSLAAFGAQVESTKPNLIWLGFGYDYTLFSTEIGYGRAVDITRINRTLVLLSDLTLPMLKPDLGDFRARVGGSTSLVRHNRFFLPIKAKVVFRRAQTSICTAFGFGSELALQPSLQFDRLLMGVEIIWDQQWSTHIRHSDFYREFVYADAKDGWYRLPAFVFRYGARIGILIRQRVELLLMGGYEQDGKLDYRTPPIYVILHTNIRL